MAHEPGLETGYMMCIWIGFALGCTRACMCMRVFMRLLEWKVRLCVCISSCIVRNTNCYEGEKRGEGPETMSS